MNQYAKLAALTILAYGLIILGLAWASVFLFTHDLPAPGWVMLGLTGIRVIVGFNFTARDDDPAPSSS